jgi:hypothetical protein
MRHWATGLALDNLGLASCNARQASEAPAGSADAFAARINQELGELQKPGT